MVVGAGLLVATRGDSDDATVATARDRTASTARTPPSVTVPATEAPTTALPAPTPAATAAPPPAAGPPFAVGTARTTAEDKSRSTAARGSTPASASRTLPLTVRYPASGSAGSENDGAAAAAGRFPLVVFAHGYDIAAADYAGFLRDLAAQGFVVAAPDFPRSSTAFPGPPTQADIDEQARDAGFLVSAFTNGSVPGPWSGHLADGEAGVVGHSDGGNTAARVASNSCCFDARFGAAVILSGDEGTSGGEWAVGGSPPMLLVQGTADSINPWSLSQELYDDAASPKTLVAIDGAGHLEPYTSGPQRRAIVALVSAFLRARLVDPATLAQVTDRANRDGLRVAASS